LGTSLEKERAVTQEAGVRTRRVALGIAVTLLLLVQGWAVLNFLGQGWDALAFPYPLNYGEGPLLDQSVRLAEFQNIYRGDLREPPYVVSNYPPLFPLVQAVFVGLFGPAFWYGRLISLLSAAAVTLLVGLTLHALTRDRLASVAGALIFPAMPYVVRWSSLARVDLLGLALSWGGLFVLARWPHKRWSVVAAGLLLVAAVYTRQTYALAAPLAAFVWLLAQGQKRRALELAGVAGGASLILFGILNVFTGGGLFLNMVTANLNDFRWERVSLNALGALLACPLLLIGALAFLAFAPRASNRSWWLVTPYLGASVPLALLVGKVGSDVNYLLELSAALGLVTGAVISWQRKRPRVRTLLIVLLAVQVLALGQSSRVASGLQDYVIEQRDEVGQLSRIVAEAKGPVLTDDYMGLLPLNGRRIYLQPFEMTQLAHDNAWDQRPLLRDIEEERFPVIMMWKPPFAREIKRDRWTPEMLKEIGAHYEPAKNDLADMVIYRPKTEP
jgi:4-amino-4-deoxy-L-arabinose transferase-like glycosyltransferase